MKISIIWITSSIVGRCSISSSERERLPSSDRERRPSSLSDSAFSFSSSLLISSASPNISAASTGNEMYIFY